MTLSWMQGLDDGRILYSTYIEALLQALNGKYVLSGLSCSTDGESLNVNIEAGTVRYDGVDYNYAGGSVTLNTGEDDRDRVDVIVWDYNGGSPTISVLQGSRWLNIGGSLKPMSERISDTQIPLALVIVRAGATSIEVADVYDVRVNMVAKLSDLQIDADKDWNGKSIYNVNEISVGGNATVLGDLTVSGTTTTVDSQNLVVQDNEITLNNGEAGAGVTLDNAGIRIDRGTEIDARLIWDETMDKWKAGIEGSEEDIILRTEFDTHTHTRSEVTDFFSSPFWDNIPDKPSTFPSSLSQLTIDTDKDWNGKRITNARLFATGTPRGSYPPARFVGVGDLSDFIISVQDGTGRVQFYWNATPGPSPTFIVGGEHAGKILFNHPGGPLFNVYWADGSGAAAGDPITWEEKFSIRTNGDVEIAGNILAGNILPKVDNRHSLGSSSLRWANIYGVNVYAGDLCFEEKECAVCGQPFEVDDEIVLKAYKIDKYTRTVPIHLRCSKAYKELEARLKLIEEKDGGGV